MSIFDNVTALRVGQKILDELEKIDDIAYDGLHGVIHDDDALQGIRDSITELKEKISEFKQ